VLFTSFKRTGDSILFVFVNISCEDRSVVCSNGVHISIVSIKVHAAVVDGKDEPII